MSFDDKVRKMLGAPPESRVDSEVRGGGEVQIGDMTWDYEEQQIVVIATIPHQVGQRWKWERSFDSLPDLWQALEEADDEQA